MIVNRITQYRTAAGLSPADISSMFKIPYRIVQQWEKGETKPPAWAEQQIINKLKTMPRRGGNFGTSSNPFQKANPFQRPPGFKR